MKHCMWFSVELVHEALVTLSPFHICQVSFCFVLVVLTVGPMQGLPPIVANWILIHLSRKNKVKHQNGPSPRRISKHCQQEIGVCEEPRCTYRTSTRLLITKKCQDLHVTTTATTATTTASSQSALLGVQATTTLLQSSRERENQQLTCALCRHEYHFWRCTHTQSVGVYIPHFPGSFTTHM